MNITHIFLLCALTTFSCAFGETSPSKQEIDLLAEKTLSEWGIPGIGLAVVHKGKPIAFSGYGVKRRGSTDPVTEETIFQIASLTKAFTAATVGMLVEEGKLSWETPIKEYLPEFKLKDEYATLNMTLQDLLSHRTGLPGTSKDCWRLWYHTNRTEEDIIRRLQYVDPAYSFRSHFSYNNMAYLVASKVVEKSSGTSWPRFCEERIFAPLSMKRTTLSNSFLEHDKNVASAHLPSFIQKEPIPRANWENMAAAGGISSCAKDMASWLLYCLSSQKALQEAKKPKSILESEGLFDSISNLTWPMYAHEQKIVAYGFGWGMYSLDNKTVLFHTGLSDGMESFLAMVPEEQLGIAILTNQTPHLGAVCLTNELLDIFLHQQNGSWHEKGHEIVAKMAQELESQKAALYATKRQLEPTLPLSEYVGIFEHPGFGTISTSLHNNQLKLELWTKEKGVLKCFDANRFEVINFPSAPSLPWLFEFKLTQNKRQVQAIEVPHLGVFKKIELRRISQDLH